MEEGYLDYILVPLGLLVLGMYHVWLLLEILQNPKRTVIGLNAESRRLWVSSVLTDPMKNGVLAAQTLRNSIMASTLLATIAITLCSLITVFVSRTTGWSNAAVGLIYGSRSRLVSSLKYFTILLCFLVAFLCNVQSVRYYADCGFLLTVPLTRGVKEHSAYVARNLNRGGYFWSAGLHAFYISFPLFLWTFGPIPMFVCCCVMAVALYLLDTTASSTRPGDDVESAARSL